eukprot:GHVP01059992.1.p1 GENE.GHVP01059992.1~~GHVP01059992.1.p1  ORF type:complete len:348 (+),score=68.95 GHVP01059992.1:2-1045(+)
MEISSEEPLGQNKANTTNIKRFIEKVDGREWLVFKNSSRESLNRLLIEGIEDIPTNTLTPDFKLNHSIFPEALYKNSHYKGTRWIYKKRVNELSWKICILNQDRLDFKKGLLKKAVVSYIELKKAIKTEEALKDTIKDSIKNKIEKNLSKGYFKPRKQNNFTMGSTMTFQWMEGNKIYKETVFIEVENVNIDSLTFDFKQRNCINIHAILKLGNNAGIDKNEYEEDCYINGLGWALASLNMDKLDGKRSMIQKAIDAYLVFNCDRNSFIVNGHLIADCSKDLDKKIVEDNRYGGFSFDKNEDEDEDISRIVKEKLKKMMEDGIDVGFADGIDDATILSILEEEGAEY